MADITALTTAMSRIAGGLENMIQQQAEQHAAFAGGIGGRREFESIRQRREEIRQGRRYIQQQIDAADRLNDFTRNLSSASILSGDALRAFAQEAVSMLDLQESYKEALGETSQEYQDLADFLDEAKRGIVDTTKAQRAQQILQQQGIEAQIRDDASARALDKENALRGRETFISLYDKAKDLGNTFASVTVGLTTMGQGLARSGEELQAQFANNVPGMMLMSRSVDEFNNKMQLVSWTTGMSAEAAQQLVAANRQTVRSVGGANAMMTALAKNKEGVFELFGEMDGGGQAMAEFTTMLLRSGVAVQDLAGSMGAAIVDLEALSQQTGLSGKELLEFYQTVNQSDREQMQLLGMAEEDRKSRVKSYADMASWGAALNMTAQETAQILEAMRPDPNKDLKQRMIESARLQMGARMAGMSEEDAARLAYLKRQRTLTQKEQEEQIELTAKLSQRMATLAQGEAGSDADVRYQQISTVLAENMEDVEKTNSVALKMEQAREADRKKSLKDWSDTAKATEKSRGLLSDIYKWWTTEFAAIVSDPGFSIAGGALMTGLGVIKDVALLVLSMGGMAAVMGKVTAAFGALSGFLGLAAVGATTLLGAIVLIPIGFTAIANMIHSFFTKGTLDNYISDYLSQFEGFWNGLGATIYAIIHPIETAKKAIQAIWDKVPDDMAVIMMDIVGTVVDGFKFLIEQIRSYLGGTAVGKLLGFGPGEGTDLGAIPSFIDKARSRDAKLSEEMIEAQDEFRNADAEDKKEMFKQAQEQHAELVAEIGTANTITPQMVASLKLLEQHMADMVEINEQQLGEQEKTAKNTGDAAKGGKRGSSSTSTAGD